MARKSNKNNSFADLVRRLNEMSNMTPEQERSALMEAAMIDKLISNPRRENKPNVTITS